MADNNYSIIKPVEGLENIATLDAVKRREERKQHKQMNEQKNEEDQQTIDSEDEQNIDNKPAQNKNSENQDTNTVDYQA